MGLFGRKDWNVIAVIFERKGLFQINGNRVKGKAAEKSRDGAKAHQRTAFWAVFNQKGSFVEGGPGPSAKLVPPETLKALTRDLARLNTVLGVLKELESGKVEKVAKPLSWEELA